MQPIPETLKPIDPTVPSQPTLLADQVQQIKDRQRGDFVSNLQTVSAINPDQFAKATHLERLTGIPADVLHKQSDKLQMLLQGNKYAGVYDNYARTARALADGKTAALAQDDIDNLTRIEHAALRTKFDEQSWADRNVFTPLQRWWESRRQRSQFDLAQDFGEQRKVFDTIDQAEAAGQIPYPSRAERERLGAYGLQYLQGTAEERAKMRSQIAGSRDAFVEGVAQREQALNELPIDRGSIRAQELGGGLSGTANAVAEDPAFIWRSGFESAPNMLESLAAGAVAGPAGAGVAGFNSEFGAKRIDVLREAGVDLSKPSEVLRALQDDGLMADAEKRASLKAAGTTAVDLLSFGLAGKLLAPVSLGGKALSGTQRELVNLAAQFPVQGGLEAAGEAAGQFAADGKVDGGEVLMEGLAGSGMSTFDVLTFGGDRLIGAVRDGLAKARHAKMAAQGLGDMVDSALSSKLRGRDAETFRKVTEEQLRDSQLESVWIPAEELAKLNQSGMVNLPGLLDEVPGLGEQFAEASARGGSVQIKTSDYLTHFADLHEQLADHVRVKVDGMSVADISAWEQEQAAEIEDLANQMRDQVDPVREAATNMVGELMNAGFARADAEQYAAAHVSVLANLAQRTGRTLDDLQQQFPLDVVGEAPQQLQRAPVDDVRLALGRLRAGDIPRPADMFGKSLIEYLRDAGGVDDIGGELAALDTDQGRVGRNRIGRAGGMSLDDAAMQAWERGYFPGVPREEVGPQLIIDAVRDELAGTPRYSVEQENATLRDQADILQRLQDYIDQQGIDLATATDDQVIERLRQPDGQQYQQAGDQAVGPFGPILTDYKGDAQGAIAKLTELQTGEAVAALSHPEIGDIDLVWGSEGTGQSDGYGLAKLVKYHPEVLGDLQGFIDSLKKDEAGSGKNRVRLRSDNGFASVRLEWDGQAKHWLMTAFEVKAATGTRTDTTDSGATDDTARRSSGPDDIVEQTMRTFYQSSAPDSGDSRGFITFTPKGQGRRKFKITLTAKRDLSTLIHELGHFYLEVLGELIDADAPPQLKADYDAILRWLGVSSIDQISTEQHEQWARGFERYLAEGKAPNPELQGAFARFKRWLLAIYKDLTRLNVELTDEIRGVMDRLVASDEQIEAANQVVQAMPLFEDAKKAGMTDEEYQAYVEQVELAGEDARVSVEQEIIREEERSRSKWWSEELGRIRNEVAEEIDLLPEYQVQKALRKGVMPDGREVDLKLQTGEIRERYGLGVLRKLSFLHAKEGGMPMDMVANLFGYGSGDEMVKAVLAAPSRSDAIEIEAQQRMRERHGTKASGEAAEKAMAAVHNERRADVMLKELQALAKQGNRKQVTSQQVLRLAAERIMQQRRVRDIQPFEYQRAEAKAGRLAFDAAAKGDLGAAYQHKQQQLLNFHLYRQAVKARDTVDSIVDRMKGYGKQSKREKLGKAGQEYLDQIDTLMEQYEFRTVSLRELNRRTSFLAWYQDQLAAGNEPFVPEFILQSKGRTNYRDLSLEQLQELDEFAKHINHLAGLKNKLLANQRIKDFGEARDQLIAAAYANNDRKKAPPVDRETMSALERLGDKVDHLSSSLLKMEQIIEWLDGGDVGGPWSQVFWQPFVEAQAHKDDLNKQFTVRMTELVDAFVKERGDLTQQVHIKAIGQPMTKNGILSVALNMGNASNQEKLLKGRNWDENVLAEITSHMDKRDWEFVQSMWDLVEQLWPQIEQLERDLHGIPPAKVDPVPVTNQFGTYSGGYWPLVYDTSSAEYAGVANNLKDSTGLFEDGYAKATTPKGHTKARVDGFAAPIMLDVGIVSNHLGMVIHDLTHRKAIRDAAKIISDRQIKQALNDTLGARVADQFNPWLQGVANDMVMDSRKGIDSWIGLSSKLRGNLAIAWLGFSATTGLQQILGYSQSLEYLSQKGGRRYLFKGLREFVTHPFQVIDQVNAMSGEMRNRQGNLDASMREVVRQIAGKRDPLAMVQRLSMRHIGIIQSLVDYPTWLAGYRQALDAGEATDMAIQAGDRAVRLSQMAAGPKDLAAVQRKDGLMRALTVVYSYFSLLYNRQVDLKRSLQTAKGFDDYLNVMSRSLFLIAMPALLAPLVTGNGPDDDEGWAEWAALKIAVYPLMGVPLLRDAASAIESGWGYRGATPIGALFETVTRTVGTLSSDEPNAQRIMLNAIDLAGYTFGLPSTQAKRTAKYVWALAEGERPDDDVADFMRGILFGPPKE